MALIDAEQITPEEIARASKLVGRDDKAEDE
jgi:hypothetical protein